MEKGSDKAAREAFGKGRDRCTGGTRTKERESPVLQYVVSLLRREAGRETKDTTSQENRNGERAGRHGGDFLWLLGLEKKKTDGMHGELFLSDSVSCVDHIDELASRL